MDLSSSIYLFLKSNIKGNNKPRRSSDTVLCSSDLYNSERELMKEMRLSDISSVDFEGPFFFENNHGSLILPDSLYSQSHNSLNNQNKTEIFELNEKHLLQEKITKNVKQRCSSQLNESVLFNELSPEITKLPKSTIFSLYNRISSKNCLQVPSLEVTCKLPFKLKSNVNSRKSSLIEEKRSSRRFRSAPNSRQKNDQSAVFSISKKEKGFEKSPFQQCKMCKSNRIIHLKNNPNT